MSNSEEIYTPYRIREPAPVPGVVLVLAIIGACCVGWFIGGLMEIIENERAK